MSGTASARTPSAARPTRPAEVGAQVEVDRAAETSGGQPVPVPMSGVSNQQALRSGRASADGASFLDTAGKLWSAVMGPGAGAKPPPPNRYGSLDDPYFNAKDIADVLNRAIDSEEHTVAWKSDGIRMTEDISRERRKVDATTVIARLENRTPLQINEIRVLYAAPEKRSVDALDRDMFGGGECEPGRRADLTEDQARRIAALLQGTQAEPSRWFYEEDAKRSRLTADTIELHELLADDLDGPKRERVMQLHRRPLTDIDVMDSIYAQLYGESALAYDINLRLSGMQLFRLSLLREGETAKADAVAIEDKRRQIEKLNERDAEFDNQDTAERLLSSLSGTERAVREIDRKKRVQLTADIETIIEQNKREALEDKTNLGRQSGDVVAARLRTILKQGNGRGQTLGDLLSATLAPASAKAITAAVDPRSSGADELAETAAAQLLEMVRNHTVTSGAVEAMLQALRRSAMHDLQAKAFDPTASPEERQAIGADPAAALEQLAQHYIDALVQTYDRLAGTSDPNFAQVVSDFSDADARHLEFVQAHGGVTSSLADLQRAMDARDIDGVKAVLRRQSSGEDVKKLVDGYNAIGHGRNLTRELFGFFGAEGSPVQAMHQNANLSGGLVSGRDAELIGEWLARPMAGKSDNQGSAQVEWMAGGAAGEYDTTMEHRGKLRRIGELTGDPETKKLMGSSLERLNELKLQWERTTDPQDRQHLFSEISKARAALTGDADAYEEETEQIVAEIRSAASFVVSFALALALPGLGAGLSFVEATALNIGANIAANIVIRGDSYGVSDLEDDLLGGVLGAAGGRLGEKLLGNIAKKIAGPVAREIGLVAERVGIQTELSAAAKTLTSEGERIVINTAELEAELGGSAAAAVETPFVSVAEKAGGILGGTFAAKIPSGDFSVSGDDVLLTAAGLLGGRMAGRRAAPRAAQPAAHVAEGAVAPTSRGSVDVVAPMPSPPTSTADVVPSSMGESAETPASTTPSTNTSVESGSPPSTPEPATRSTDEDLPQAPEHEPGQTPAAHPEFAPATPEEIARSMTPREVPEAEVRRVRGSTPVNPDAAGAVQQIIQERMADLLAGFANDNAGQTATAARGNLPHLEADFRTLMAEVGTAPTLTPTQRTRALTILNQARGAGRPARGFYEAFRDYAWSRLNVDPDIQQIATTPGSGVYVAGGEAAIRVDVVVTDGAGQRSSATVSFDFEHLTRLSDQPFRDHSDAEGANANLMPMLAEANRYYQEALRNRAGVHEFDAFGHGAASNDDIERFMLQHQLGSAHSSFRAEPEPTPAGASNGASAPPPGGYVDISSDISPEPAESIAPAPVASSAPGVPATQGGPSASSPTASTPSGAGAGTTRPTGDVTEVRYEYGEERRLPAGGTPAARLPRYAGKAGYDAVRILEGDVPVQELVIKLHLDPARGVSAADLARLQEEVLQGVQGVYNDPHHTLRNGDTLRVRVEFTADPLDAHSIVSVAPAGSGQRPNQLHWVVGDDPIIHAHEIGHHLGLLDEYVESPSEQRPSTSRNQPGAPGVRPGRGIMGGIFDRLRNIPDPGARVQEHNLGEITDAIAEQRLRDELLSRGVDLRPGAVDRQSLMSGDFDAIGPNQELELRPTGVTEAGLPALERRLMMLRYQAANRGVSAEIYFEPDTPWQARRLARDILGEEHIHLTVD